jgi:glyoxylase-like metal-dependent hydrolase (beta-lactamase superfamily II)
MKLLSVDTGTIEVRLTDLFLNLPSNRRQSPYPTGENGRCTLSVRSLIIMDGSKKIIIDTGVGDTIQEDFLELYQYRPIKNMMQLLAESSLGLEDITDVILTHLHFDHCGGSVHKANHASSGGPYTPVFSKATHWISRKQWEWAGDNRLREPDSYFDHTFLPLKKTGKLNLVEKEGEIMPNIFVHLFDGHTRGMMLPLIRKKDRVVAFAGDLIPTVTHVDPQNQMSYDLDPIRNRDEKMDFLSKAASQEWLIVMQHDHYHECCTVEMTREGYRVKEICSTASLQ